MEEKRIYVVVPETIQVKLSYPSGESINNVEMVPGRLMAQCAHVVSHMRVFENQIDGGEDEWEPITTIVLSVRNSKELNKVLKELNPDSYIEECRVYTFHDTNSEVYGTGDKQLTAICTTPVLQSTVDAALGHLELYGAR